MKCLLIVLMCIALAVAYGIVHDQITARICVEYFTIGHPPVIPTNDPTLLGLVWGVIATWWVGLLLGILLAMASRVGSWPKVEPRSLVRPLLRLAMCTFSLAVVAGIAGGIAASNGWVFLVGDMAERVPQNRQVPFLIDLWAHSASYVAGFVGGVGVVVWVVLKRRRMQMRKHDGD